MSISLRQLRKLVAVADAGSFTAAAAELHIAQPALSQEIRKLEQELGLRLLDRDAKHVALTADGRQIYDQAVATLHEYDTLGRLAERLRHEGGGILRVGFMAQGPGELLHRAVMSFRESHPHVKVTLLPFGFNDCFLGITRRLTDVSFSIGPLDEHREVASAVLFEENVVAAMASDHPLACRERLHVDDILEEPLFADTHPPGRWRDYWDAIPHRRGRPPRIAGRFDTHDEWLEGIRLGGGISICPASTPDYYHRPGLVFIPLDGMEPAEHHVVWRKRDTDPALRDFVRLARTLAREPTPGRHAPAVPAAG